MPPCSHAGFRQEESFLGARLPSLVWRATFSFLALCIFFNIFFCSLSECTSTSTPKLVHHPSIHTARPAGPFMSPQLAKHHGNKSTRLWILRPWPFCTNTYLADFKSHLVSILICRDRCANMYNTSPLLNLSFSLNGRGCATCRIIVVSKRNGKRGCVTSSHYLGI